MNKKSIYDVLNISDPNDKVSQWLNVSIIILIILNVLSVIFETVESIYSSYVIYFNVFETISVMIFTIEYLLRLWTCLLFLSCCI